MSKLRTILSQARGYVSPLFMLMLAASFILWYIAKLGYTYTTDQKVRLDIDGVPVEITCVVEGLGTNLFGYRAYMRRHHSVSLSDLKYHISDEEGHEGKIIIDPKSLQDLISIKYSDIKVVAISDIPEIDDPTVCR